MIFHPTKNLELEFYPPFQQEIPSFPQQNLFRKDLK